MKDEQLKIGVVLSYVAQGIHLLSALIYTPIMLRILGQSEYGLYQLVYSVVSYLGVLSFGFGSSYMRFYSRYKVKKEETNIAKLNGMFMTIFCVISAIVLLIGYFFVMNTQLVFGTGLAKGELEIAKVLLILMVINLAITFPNSVFDCYVTAYEQFLFQRVIIILQNILNPFIAIPIMLLGYGSIGVVCVTTSLTIAKFVINIWFCFKKLRMRFNFKKFDFKLLKEMWGFTFFIFINSLVDQINWSVDKFLLGRLVGTTAVAVYGIAGQINSLYIQLSTAISTVFIPRVNKMVAEEKESSKIDELFIKVGRIQFWVVFLVLSGIIFFGKQFIILWAGEDYRDAYMMLLFLAVPTLVPLIQNLGIEIERAKNKHKVRSIVYLLIAILNIFISIPLIKVCGGVGAAIGTAIAMVLGQIIFMNFYYSRGIGLNMVLFWKSIISVIPSLIPVVVAGVVLNKVFVNVSWLALMIAVGIYSIIYAISVFLLGFNDYERNLIKKYIKK